MAAQGNQNEIRVTLQKVLTASDRTQGLLMPVNWLANTNFPPFGVDDKLQFTASAVPLVGAQTSWTFTVSRYTNNATTYKISSRDFLPFVNAKNLEAGDIIEIEIRKQIDLNAGGDGFLREYSIRALRNVNGQWIDL